MTGIKWWLRILFNAEPDCLGRSLAGNFGSNSASKIDARGNTPRGDYVAVSNDPST
jgi:hypothetical protein